jgi:hypothetical protein
MITKFKIFENNNSNIQVGNLITDSDIVYITSAKDISIFLK